MPEASVIISTYNQPKWLQKCLWGYANQLFKDFEIVIADDGSKEETKEIIEAFQKTTNLSIQHIWHPDNGFQKCAILNKATLAAQSDYLIFTDGDCIPRKDFIKTHIEQRDESYFLSGGYCKLPMELSKKITKDDIFSEKAFDVSWLVHGGLKGMSQKLKLGSVGIWPQILDKVTTAKPTWNGNNASTWKKYILEVNGHNEDMAYGGQDRELGERLLNLGLKPKQIRHRAVSLHLDHPRSYRTKESIEKNKAIRNQTKQSGITWTDNGIKKS